jgi:hypothetical protein
MQSFKLALSIRQAACRSRFRTNVLVPFCMLMAAIVLSGAPIWAQELEGVEAGKEALGELGKTSWYDSSSDQYRVPDDLVIDDAEGRRSDWLGKQQQWNAPNGPGPITLSWWGTILTYFAPVMLYGILPALVAVLLVFALQSILPEPYRFLRRNKTSEAKNEIDLDRISDLPFTVDMKPTDPLGEARRCMENGDFERAIIYLFAYQLLQLDARHLISLQRGKTNRVYLRELRPRPELRSIMESTVLAFEQVFFGRYKLEQARFMYCWNKLDDFHRQLNQSSTEAATTLQLGGVT